MSKLFKRNGMLVVEDLKLPLAAQIDLNEGYKLEVKVILQDLRKITEQQRKFIFALIGEISHYTGEHKEELRLKLSVANAIYREIETESLSNASVSYANDLIEFIILYMIDNEIPFSNKPLLEYEYSFNTKQVYAMALKRICVVCGRRADLHHTTQRVGMGNDRTKISHVGMEVLPLCREHHTEAHTMSNEKFINKYILTPIVVDKKLDYFIKKGTLKYYKGEKEWEILMKINYLKY